ncbi:MAG TPA: hypothetical protein VLY45_04180 [Nitrospiria bacterium]|nr:hypothetical protein [Nitrospiria bacterium]
MKRSLRQDHQSTRPTAAPSSPEEQEHARLSHLMVTAQLVGKSSLGIGFLMSIYGLTDHHEWAIRTGLALLLTGMAASLTSLVHSFNRRRLARHSASGPPPPPSNRRPGPP